MSYLDTRHVRYGIMHGKPPQPKEVPNILTNAWDLCSFSDKEEAKFLARAGR